MDGDAQFTRSIACSIVVLILVIAGVIWIDQILGVALQPPCEPCYECALCP